MNFISAPPQSGLEEQWTLTRTRFNEWLHGELFTIRWFLMLALFLITAYLWWKKVDKSRLNEMMLYTSIVILFIIVLDELGDELTLWYYTVDLFFLFPPITAINITCMPLVYMLVYQHFKTWKSFFIATIVMSTVFCFVFEPIFVWAGIYKMLNWKSYYGFPIYIAVAIMPKCIVSLIFPVQHKKKLHST